MRVRNVSSEAAALAALCFRRTFLSVTYLLTAFVASSAFLGCQRASPVGPGSTLSGQDLVIERGFHLYIMRNEDSTRLVSVIDTSSLIKANSILVPKLSPDRKNIAFYASKIPESIVLCVVGVDGKGLRIVATVSMPGQMAQLTYSWSPDGMMIAYSSPKDGSDNIYVAKTNGAGEQEIPSPGDFNLFPRWSYDSKLISFTYFSTQHSLPRFAVYDLSNSKLIGTAGNSTLDVNWSPREYELVYTATLDSSSLSYSRHLYRIRVDTSGLSQPHELIGPYSGALTSVWRGGWNPPGNSFLVETSEDTTATSESIHAQILLVDIEDGTSHPIMALQGPGSAFWSESGDRVYFTKWHLNLLWPDDFDLYVMNSDGSQPQLLIEGIGNQEW